MYYQYWQCDRLMQKYLFRVPPINPRRSWLNRHVNVEFHKRAHNVVSCQYQIDKWPYLRIYWSTYNQWISLPAYPIIPSFKSRCIRLVILYSRGRTISFALANCIHVRPLLAIKICWYIDINDTFSTEFYTFTLYLQ